MSSRLCSPRASSGPCLGLWFVLEMGFSLGIMKRTCGNPLRKRHPPLPGLISPLNTVIARTMRKSPELPLIPSGWREKGWGGCDCRHPRGSAVPRGPLLPSPASSAGTGLSSILVSHSHSQPTPSPSHPGGNPASSTGERRQTHPCRESPPR